MNRALIVGANGQDGRLLYDRLQREGWSLIGIGRETVRCTEDGIASGVDINDREQVEDTVARWRPDAIYYLAAHHHSSQEQINADVLDLFERSYATHVRGLIHFLEAMKNRAPASRLFYAASSLVFGDAESALQNELTPLNPRCVYGITKTAGVHACRYFRQVHGVHASAGILYNHESIYREERFVAKKIARAAAEISRGVRDELVLGDLSVRIDWGYAPDFVDAMVRTVALRDAGDFVVATGEAHSVREFVEIAFQHLGLDWTKHVQIDSGVLHRQRRTLIGDSTKLRAATGWQPSVKFDDMVRGLAEAAAG